MIVPLIYPSDAIELSAVLGLEKPLYISAPNAVYRRKTQSCIVRSRDNPFPENSFFYLTEKQFDIYIACPELCFLQVAREQDMIDLLLFGFDICAIYYVTKEAEFGQAGRIPLTSVETLRQYISEAHAFYGASKALNALRYIRNDSNSPMETRLAIFLILPESLGGCGIPWIEMNSPITLLPEGAKLLKYKTVRGDMVIHIARMVIEYNSDKVHLNSQSYTDDMNRQSAVKNAGYKYFAITKGNVNDISSLMGVVNIIRKELSLPPLDENDLQRQKLFHRLFDR